MAEVFEPVTLNRTRLANRFVRSATYEGLADGDGREGEKSGQNHSGKLCVERGLRPGCTLRRKYRTPCICVVGQETTSSERPFSR